MPLRCFISRSCFPLLLALVVPTCSIGAAATAPTPKPADTRDTVHPCYRFLHVPQPTALITNGTLDIVVYLPDAGLGYYRSSRFDWSGVVACVSLRGHTCFGQWFAKYDPYITDAITGPVEEFREPDSEIGFDQAPVGGRFLKIGVGLLARPDTQPYTFRRYYRIVDHGKWTVSQRGRSITFHQELISDLGYSYMYEKKLWLDPVGPTLHLRHELRNTGTKPLRTFVYDHDFFMLDGAITRAPMRLRFGFSPKPETPLPASQRLQGNTLMFAKTYGPEEEEKSVLTGASSRAEDNRILFTDGSRGLGVEQTGDRPVTKVVLWTTARTVCPEAYIAVNVSSGQSQRWNIAYRFIAPPTAQSHDNYRNSLDTWRPSIR